MKNFLFNHKVLPASLILFFILSGCSPSNVILRTKYRPGKIIDPILPFPERITLFLEPVTGMDESLWYTIRDYSWTLEKSPSILVRDAFEMELPFWGIELSNNSKKAKGRLKVSIRWFGPYGNTPIAAAVILSVTLYRGDEDEQLWHGKVEGGVKPRPFPAGTDNINTAIEGVIYEALSKAMAKLRWNGEFYQAIGLISGMYGS